MKRLVQSECNYVIVGICGNCSGRVVAASTIDGPLAVTADRDRMVFTPQCRDCGAIPIVLKMQERRTKGR